MKVEIVGNRADSDPGLILAALDEFDPTIRLRIREEPRSWGSSLDADLVLHLGSSWSVYWSEVSDYVAAESALIRHSLERGVPVLGVCFGAQMLAHTCGGSVQRAPHAEIGWHDVIASDPGTSLGGRWMQWHYDSFSVPPGFEVLATSNAGVQAIRRGRALGVQFHPEANEAIVTRWIEGEGLAELAKAGISPTSLLADTRVEVERTEHATRHLIEWFLADVAQGPTTMEPSN